jgi:uncharacterized protein (DUF433 family)
MNWLDHIVSDKHVLLDKPSIKGTRISAAHIIRLLAQGWSEKDILDNLPETDRFVITCSFRIFTGMH